MERLEVVASVVTVWDSRVFMWERRRESRVLFSRTIFCIFPNSTISFRDSGMSWEMSCLERREFRRVRLGVWEVEEMLEVTDSRESARERVAISGVDT